jgi:Fic family protein
MRIKHNKFRNTGVLFELLVRQIASDTLANTDSKAVKIVKKFFHNSELAKEHKLYHTILTAPRLSEGKAEVLVNTTVDMAKKLNKEQLLKEKQTAAGKTKDEATMLLNHKEALDFILSNKEYINPLTISRIEDLHSILMNELKVGRNIRKRRVGISGTNYTPLDNEFQIREALQAMCNLICSKTIVFEKALLALVLISYIQPFEDGNKRTARIISNAIFMNEGFCPISFRTIDSIEYKKAMLVFYEQNNITPFKKIFIDQFEFAVKTYF